MAGIIEQHAAAQQACKVIRLYVVFASNATLIMIVPQIKPVSVICALTPVATKATHALRMLSVKPCSIVLSADVPMTCRWAIHLPIARVDLKSRCVKTTVTVPAVWLALTLSARILVPNYHHAQAQLNVVYSTVFQCVQWSANARLHMYPIAEVNVNSLYCKHLRVVYPTPTVQTKRPALTDSAATHATVELTLCVK